MNEFDLGDVKPEMNLYKSDLKQFRMKTPLKLFCKTQKRFVEPPQDFQKVIAKYSWPSDRDVTLEDVEQFREKHACHYNLRNFAIMIGQLEIEGSCVYDATLCKLNNEAHQTN